MWAVVPVKEIGDAKQRLADHLDPVARRDLVEAMLADVLEVLASVPSLDGVVVVTRDPRAARLAEVAGARVLEETKDGLNAALEQAAADLRKSGADGLVVVPADIPTVTAADIDAVVALHAGTGRRVSLVSDRHGEGTNCMACSPPGVCRFHFGAGSFAAHQAAAREAGAQVGSLELAGIQLDVDTDADLEALASRQPGPGTRGLLDRWAAAERGAPAAAGVCG